MRRDELGVRLTELDTEIKGLQKEIQDSELEKEKLQMTFDEVEE